MMQTRSVVLAKPEQIGVQTLALAPVGHDDVVVDIDWSGISTGTEKLLWSGRMPPFPGLGYPLVPGYEAAGRIVEAGAGAVDRIGQSVFVPGAACYGEVRGLFGGASQRLITPSRRAVTVTPSLGSNAVLLALAATAHHALAGSRGRLPELIVGHGVLGRLLARITMSLGGAPPVVWETREDRRAGATGYPVISPGDDPRRDYALSCDASGDSSVIDALIARSTKGGEVILAGFYQERIALVFVPAFLREIRLRIAAEWSPSDLDAVAALVAQGRLDLDGLISHVSPAEHAADAYRTAFEDAGCLKMILDWRTCQ